MGRKIIFILWILCAGCVPIGAPAPPKTAATNETYLYTGVTKFVDKEVGVVCWVYQSHGISCLPLSETNLGKK